MYHDHAALICDMIMQVHSLDTGQVCGAGLYPVLLTLWLPQPTQAQLHQVYRGLSYDLLVVLIPLS